jgi:hypothetical protein
VLRYRDVAAVLHDRRWRELGPDALRAAGVTSGPLWEWFHQIMSTRGRPHRLRRPVSRPYAAQRERLRPVMCYGWFVDRFEAGARSSSRRAAPYPVRVIGAARRAARASPLHAGV